MLNFIYVRNQRLKKALNKAWTIKIVNFSPINFKNNWTNDKKKRKKERKKFDDGYKYPN